MKIATFNVNGITARLPRLLEWLEESRPDIACLQELKTSDETFPDAALQGRGLRRRLARPEGLQRRRRAGARRRPEGAPPRPARRPGRHPQPLPRGIGARRRRRLHLPAQRQPAAGSEVRLQARLVRAPHRACRRACARPATASSSRATTTSSPTDGVGDIYSPASWKKDALLQPESRAAYRRLLDQGWTDSIHKLHAGKPVYTYWDYFRNRFSRDAGLRIDHLLLNAPAAKRLRAAGVDRAVRAREKPSDHAPAWIELD